MSNNSVKDLVQENLASVVEELGYELVEVEYTRKPNGMNLTLFIDSPNGVDMDGLEKVHRVVDEKLDDLDPTHGAPYILNCSSLGLDRPLKTDKDLMRNVGAEVDISLYAKLNGAKEYTGTLDTFNDQVLTILVDGKQIEIPRESISKINKHIQF